MAAEIVGAVLSSLIVTESVPRFPARSSAEPLTSMPAVSLVIVTGAVSVEVSTPLPLSWPHAGKVTGRWELFHSSALGFGDRRCVTAGAMLSYLRETLFLDSIF